MRRCMLAGSMLSMALLSACTSSTHTVVPPSPSPTLSADAAFAAACILGASLTGAFFRRLSPIFADYE